MRGKSAISYIFREMVPTMLTGIVVFLAILLMFQALRLTEFVLVHGVDLKTIFNISVYLSVSFLPAILPMSLLFTVLLTYSRLSSESEIVAFKSIGLNNYHLATPAVFLALIVGLVSAKVSFEIAPWGNRQFEVLITQLGQSKASATFKEGVFSEGFFDLVVYANSVDNKKGLLSEVFIYDERDPALPLTIIAKHGLLVKDVNQPKQHAGIRLLDGNIHRTNDETYTKVDFETYDINLADPVASAFRKKSLLSLSLVELEERMQKTKKDSKEWLKYSSEYHKRWALAFACILFGLIGVGMGTTTNRRNVRSGSMVICLGLIVVYWSLYVTFENIARGGQIPPYIAIWISNVLYSGLAIWSLKRSSV